MAESYRLTPFATRLLRDRCRCWVIGDSINADYGSLQNMPRGWIRQLRPRAWAGYGLCNALNDGSTAAAFNGTNFPSAALKGFGTADVGGASDIWPCEYAAGPAYVGNQGAFGVTNRWIGTVAHMANWPSDWWSGVTGACRLVTYQDAGSVAKLGTVVNRNGAGVEFTGSRNLSGYTQVEVTCGSAAGDTDVQWRFDNTGYNEDGLIHRALGARFYLSGVSGLEMTFGGVSGSTVEDHVNTANVADAAITAAVSWGDIDTVIIWLGQNGTVDATWNTNMLALIDRWRSAVTAAGRTFKCLLVSQYDANGGSKYAAIADYEEAIAREYTDVSFLNLYALAGPFTLLNASYLRDTVHPNAAGYDYFAGLIQTALSGALIGEAGAGGGRATSAATAFRLGLI